MLRDFRKPLIIAAPKIGLKHPKAYSPLSEFAEGNKFQSTIKTLFGKGQANKIIFCSGKVAFDIEARLEKNEAVGVAVIRIEELAPFPVASVKAHLQSATNNADFVWVQEEPTNQGAFQFAKLHLDRILKDMSFTNHLTYVGRPSIHSFATGANIDHKLEGEALWRRFDKFMN